MISVTLSEIAEGLAQNDRFHIYIHAHPDADTLGSGVALYSILREMGKKALIVSNDPLPAKLSFISSRISGDAFCFGGETLAVKGFANAFAVSVDTAAPEQLKGNLGDCAEDIRFGIDHHVINTLICEKLFLDAKASSTGEIIYQLASLCGQKSGKDLLTKDAAESIFAAISYDTGCFKYANTTARTHAVASELLTRGVNAEEINRRLFDVKTKKQMLVDQIVYSNMLFFADGQVALTHLSLSELAQAEASHEDADHVAQILCQLVEVRVGITMRENSIKGKEPISYRFSVRANDGTDVAELCAVFGGGGHKKAAGCTVEGTLDQARERFLAELYKRL